MGGGVRVFNEDLFDKFVIQPAVQAAQEKAANSPSGRSGQSRSQASPHTHSTHASHRSRRTAPSQEERLQRKFDLARRRYEAYQEESQARVREKIAENARRREDDFQALKTSVFEGHQLVDEIEKDMTLKDMNELNKQRRKFEDWNTNVYGKIHGDITRQLNERPYQEVNVNRRRDFQQFLDATNTKGALFRDIIIPEEYDPLAPNRRCIRAQPKTIDDPVKRVLARRDEEERMLEGPKPQVPLGRKSDLKLEHWASGKIEATPHGFFARMMAKPQGKGDNLYASSIVLDHYNIATGRAVVNAEFPRGKRTTASKKTLDDHPLKMKQMG